MHLLCPVLLSALSSSLSSLVPSQSCQCLAWKPHPNVAWEAESQHVVAGYSDGTIRVFSISRTEMELKMHPHATALTAIAYSTDGEIACCNSRDVAWGAQLAFIRVTQAQVLPPKTCTKSWAQGELVPMDFGRPVSRAHGKWVLADILAVIQASSLDAANIPFCLPVYKLLWLLFGCDLACVPETSDLTQLFIQMFPIFQMFWDSAVP